MLHSAWKNRILLFSLSTLMLLFFLFPVAAFQGARSGLLLWFHQVLPSLLPFLILSNLILSCGIHRSLGRLLYPVLSRLFSLSASGCYALLLGCLSGLPLSAKVISDLYENDELTKREGVLLLTLCSNPSPMFLISYAAVSQLALPDQPYLVLLLVLGSALLSHLIFRLLFHTEQAVKEPLPAPCALPQELSFSVIDRCIMNGFEIAAKIGGYIVLFSIVSSIFSCLTAALPNSPLTLLPLSVLEITTGIKALCSGQLSAPIRLTAVVACCNFGGLSVFAQTKSVLSSRLLPFRQFAHIKLLQTLLGLLLTQLVCRLL